MSIVSASVRNRPRPPSIGILGGVGAIASARFHLDLVTEWAKVKDAKTDDDFPRIVHVSESLGLNERGLVAVEKTAHILFGDVISTLEQCDYIAVVCNSITKMIRSDPLVEKKVLTPVAACRDALKGVTRAWLLASESTIRDRIYQDAYPHIEWKIPFEPITPCIQHLVMTGSYNKRWRNKLEDEIPDDEVIVLGCTELSTQRSPFFWHLTISPTDEMIRILCHESQAPIQA